MKTPCAAPKRTFRASFDPQVATAESAPFTIVLAVCGQVATIATVGYIPTLAVISAFRMPWVSVVLSVLGGLTTYIAFRKRCRGRAGALASCLDCGFYSAAFVWAACNTNLGFGLTFAAFLAFMLVTFHGVVFGLTLPMAAVVIVPTAGITFFTRPEPLVALALAGGCVCFILKMEHTWQRQIRQRAREAKDAQMLVARSGTRYRLLQALGKGGMGAVFRAECEDERRVAVKVLHASLTDTERQRTLARELVAVRTLRHGGIVPILDDGTSDSGQPFLVMELLEGKTLKEHVADSGGSLPWKEVAYIAESLLDVLVTAHGRGIVHRDVKPSNVFLCHDGTVKLLDFGIARLDTSLWEMTVTDGFVGTPAFTAPEQVLAPEQVDQRSDLWSVGALMYWAASGMGPRRLPEPCASLADAVALPAERLEHRQPGLSAAFCKTVNRALEHNPEDRFVTARDMVASLHEALTMKAAVSRGDEPRVERHG